MIYVEVNFQEKGKYAIKLLRVYAYWMLKTDYRIFSIRYYNIV